MVLENQKRMLLKEPLFNSPVVRKTFRHPVIYDAAIEWPRAIERRSDFSLNLILKNDQKRRLFEVALIAGMCYSELYDLWQRAFHQKLTRNEFKLYKYYFPFSTLK